MTKWIEDWFGSDYYSLLYKHRNEDEAKQFINNVVSFLKISTGSRILDCGCGRGRHSSCLAENDFDVTGLDISEASIHHAKKHEKKNLTFYSHDLRNLFRINYYDIALSLFTSFGYFEKDSENNKMMKSISSSLKKEGMFVLDFMNSEKEIKELVSTQQCKSEEVKYDVNRYVKDGIIYKEIIVSDGGKTYPFRECVKAYKENELKKFFSDNRLEVLHLFGNYKLEKFDSAKSERLILIGRKK